MKVYRSEKGKQAIRETYDQLLGAWGVPVEPLEIAPRYGETRVNAAGAAALPPLVLLHGVGDDSALMWVYNAKALAAKRRIYAVDTLGGPGKSEPGEKYGPGFDDAEWLDDVWDGLGLSGTSVAGVSHGGYLAQLYAIRRPERVRRIACISAGTPIGKGSPMKTMLKVFLPEAAFPTKGNVKRLLCKMSGKNAGAFTDNPLVLAHFTALLRGYNNMAMTPHKVTLFTEAEVSGIRDRALYLAGERDPLLTADGKAASEKLGMNVRFYPSAGHGLNHELPEEIDERLIEWFEGE